MPAAAGGTRRGRSGALPWRSGDVVTVRFVIEHTPARVVTYMAEGTVVSAPTLTDGRGLREVPLDERWLHPRASERRPWIGTELIQIFPAGRAHSLWVVRRPDRSLVGWYVNLEDPHVLAERTISTRDHVLDVWVPAPGLVPACDFPRGLAEPQGRDEIQAS